MHIKISPPHSKYLKKNIIKQTGPVFKIKILVDSARARGKIFTQKFYVFTCIKHIVKLLCKLTLTLFNSNPLYREREWRKISFQVQVKIRLKILSEILIWSVIYHPFGNKMAYKIISDFCTWLYWFWRY